MKIEELKDIPIIKLTGVGQKTAESYASLGLETITDLIMFRPKGYEDRSSRVCIGKSSFNLPTNTVVKVISKSFFGRGLKNVKATVEDTQSGVKAQLLGFNRSYLDKILFAGSYYHLYGREMADNSFSIPQYSSFEIKRIDESEIDNLSVTDNGILPVYPLSGNLTQNIIRRDIKAALQRVDHIENDMPSFLYDKYNLIDKDSAIRLMHFPKSETDVLKAMRTLSFTEIYLMEILSFGKNSKIKRRAIPKQVYKLETDFIKSLPFKLTEDQEKVLDEIRTDLSSDRPMNRLLQGDVGSGKTLVALISALHAISEGKQVAIMAPTELLARQHAITAAKLLEKTSLTVAFLDSEVKKSRRQILLEQLEKGNINLVIGTHALFSKDVKYKDLGLVVIDEQHRFGVQQRQALVDKGEAADILLMTATPIPRTLALTVYGNLNVSTIKSMPVGRLPVKTFLVGEDRRNDMYKAVGVELDRGHQAYFVYPRIDSEDDEKEIRDVKTMFDFLSDEYSNYKGALIHSKLPEEEKIEILQGFADGKYNFLVSTSVVEVGLDNPNATCMVVEHADLFGLSALHQLRGRVGRSTLQSWCFFVYSKDISEDGKKRLGVLKKTTDGFEIAQQDLRIRGPGEISGLRQSGFNTLKFTSLEKDEKLIAQAREEALKTI